MPKPWWKRAGGEREAVSADFSHALMQQVLRTELIRIKALIGDGGGSRPYGPGPLLLDP